MNILNRTYLLSIFGTLHRASIFTLIVARLYHWFMDLRSPQKSHFRVIGSYVR